MSRCVSGALALLALVGSASAAELIPRELLFGNPDRASLRVSPDGRKIAFVAPLGGVLNLWVAPTDRLDEARAVTRDTGRGVSNYFWAYSSRHLVYTQDVGGDENDHVYVVDLASGEARDLTPIDGVKAVIQAVSWRVPNEILVGLNDRNPQLHDTWRVNLLTGERTLVFENPGLVSIMADDLYRVRLGFALRPDASLVVTQLTADGPKPLMTVPQDDVQTTSPLGFDETMERLYLLDSRGRNTSALFLFDPRTGQQTLLAEDPKADVAGIIAHPKTNALEAWSSNYLRNEWRPVGDAVAGDLAYLNGLSDGEVAITSRSLDDKVWTVAMVQDDGPVGYYLYRRGGQMATGQRIGRHGRRVMEPAEHGTATLLCTNRRDLEGVRLAPMHAPVIRSRDGLDMVSYLTLPPPADPDGDGRPNQPLPAVLFVHGGPWARDEWGYNPVHQWLANRGYAVLSVNYRGSTGFGKEFLVASNREWGGKMHDDLVDAVGWLVDQKIADPRKVAIMGGSYGGYATLVGLTFTPDLFAAGVDIVGPSNLITFMESVPAYWQPAVDLFRARIGDHTTDEGRAFLTSRSPLSRVDAIVKPLLIAQGANDPRVKRAESDQIVEAMRARNIPVTYVLYPDEGHGFARPENNLSFFGMAELFLARHLGGAAEPMGDDMLGSSAQILAGAEHIPGLTAAP